MTKERAIGLLREALSDDLLKKEWLEKRQPDDDPTFGHCYTATEALYYLWGKSKGYRPGVLRGSRGTHWFLFNDKGDIADPTASQWRGEKIPYERGRGSGFLTRGPSRRCVRLLERVKARLSQPHKQ